MGLFNRISKAVSAVATSSENTPFNYGEFIVIDVETTGLSPDSHRVVHLAMLRVSNGEGVELFESLFNPEGPVGKTEIHGITQNQVDAAPKFRDKTSEILKFIENRTLVAHNARFDISFLRAEFERAGVALPWIEPFCTLKASEYYLPNLYRRKLSDCCEAIGVQIENAHTATGDVIATAKLCHYYLTENKEPRPRKKDLELISHPVIKSYDQGRADSAYIQSKISESKSVNKVTSVKSLSKIKKLLSGVGIGELTEINSINGANEYLEKLIESIEDSTLSGDELHALSELSNIYEINEQDIRRLHAELLVLVAEVALDDESISNAERQEIKEFAGLLQIEESEITSILKLARERRINKLSKSLNPLPASWKLGEPLRVGQNVVFTGCDPEHRTELEKLSKKSGITIASTVTKKTSLLVTDGTYVGNKANDAAKLNVRVVTPEQYEVMLQYIQPPVL